MDKSLEFAYKVLREHDMKHNSSVMFDIDETLITNDGYPIQPMIQLAKDASTMGYTIVILTARPSKYRKPTEEELAYFNIPYDQLGFVHAKYKGWVKQNMDNYFVLSIGDQWTDCTETEHYIKMPDLYDNRYFIR